ncbi:hypothetical protein QYE76_014767 [Lolium multiflorum]|uniref:Uncharacterized protein n=1 Tax=Lolium multiflorum TaxID=4521 RepID=A0AAD8U5L0_LOLMU|nr:hypothetical protein QYE76_014767 [Lolium multiflorum]
MQARNLLDSAAGGTFMSITLGAATKLLDDMMINYSEWHTERTPQGKKVNYVEETSSLGDKIDAIMSMLANDRSHIDPNNVPLASLVAQEENVDVNFIKNNNFNNNAYRNNYGKNNYRPYPSNNGNGYGNSYGNSYNNNKSVPSGLEVMLKEFISTQTAFNKTVEEKLGKIDVLASKVDSLALDGDLLKLKVMPEEVKDARFAKTNAIQVQINDNIRMLAELHARWDREEKEKLVKENNIAKHYYTRHRSASRCSFRSFSSSSSSRGSGLDCFFPLQVKGCSCHHHGSSFCVISSLEAFASQFTSLEADNVRLQEEVKSSSSKLDGAIKKAAIARQEVDSLKEELGKLKERLKEEETRAAEKDELLRQSSLALLEAANIPAAALDAVPNNSPANGVSMALASHQLTRELLEKGKGALARMHLMIFPKLKQDKTLGQLVEAFAVDTKEVIEVFPVPSFVDDSSGALPEVDRIQRMKDRITQMEKDLRSTYALAAIVNKKSEIAADVERYCTKPPRV